MEDAFNALGVFLLSPIFFTGTAEHFDVTVGVGYSDAIVLEDLSVNSGPIAVLKFEGKYKYFDVSIEHASDIVRKDYNFGSNRIVISKTWQVK